MVKTNDIELSQNIAPVRFSDNGVKEQTVL